MDINVINGTKWIRLNDICDILRHVVSCDEIESAGDAICSIAYMMFYDNAHKAKTEEERFAAMELPGDFVVCRPEDGIKYISYVDELGGITRDFRKAQHFEFMSAANKAAEKTNNVAKRDGNPFKPICVGVEDMKIVRRALVELSEDLANRVFGE